MTIEHRREKETLVRTISRKLKKSEKLLDRKPKTKKKNVKPFNIPTSESIFVLIKIVIYFSNYILLSVT